MMGFFFWLIIVFSCCQSTESVRMYACLEMREEDVAVGGSEVDIFIQLCLPLKPDQCSQGCAHGTDGVSRTPQKWAPTALPTPPRLDPNPSNQNLSSHVTRPRAPASTRKKKVRKKVVSELAKNPLTSMLTRKCLVSRYRQVRAAAVPTLPSRRCMNTPHRLTRHAAATQQRDQSFRQTSRGR